MENDANELKANFERVERSEAMKREIASKREESNEQRAAAAKPEQRAVFAKFLRHGVNSLTTEERAELRGTATQIAGTDSLGGFLVPEDFSNALDVAMKFAGPVEQLAQVLNTTTGALLPYPTVDDTSVIGAILAEANADTVSDMTFSAVNLGAYTYTSKIVKVSRQLLQDNAFDLEAFLVDALGQRIARGTNAAFTTGDGSSKPTGVVNGSAAGKTAASATAITAAELLDLMYSVDPAYRNAANAAFMMKDSTLSAVRKLGIGSANDYPVFMPGTAVGQPDMLFGKPVYVNNDMAAIATGNKSVVFGDFSKYVVRVAGPLQFLRQDELYAASLVVGFTAFKRVDAGLLQSNAIKHLVQA
jgi:HK97 family phage major capsid protein